MQPTPSQAAPRKALQLPQALKDLGTPPPLAEVIQSELARCPFRTREWQRWIEEEFKLQYFYGGMEVLCMDSPEGRVVVAAGSVEEVGEAFRQLPPKERGKVVLISLDGWDEVVISGPIYDED